MDSRFVGHAQRRRMGAPANIYDPSNMDYDDGSTFKGTMAMRDDPAAAAATANAKLQATKRALGLLKGGR
jgi:hypothetical protein